MNAAELRTLQQPHKDRYREDPARALITLSARATLDVDRLECHLEGPAGPIVAGLHPAAGGDGTAACSAELLLGALATCAGVTVCAVATALGLPVRGGAIEVEGDLDFRGTLGVAREVQVGFQAIRLRIRLEGELEADKVATVERLAERYCVVFQTLKTPPSFSVETTAS